MISDGDKNLSKGIQHWSLAPNKGRRFTKKELSWLPGRAAKLRQSGFNKYHIAEMIASEIGRSIDSLRYQLWHSMKLWPTTPKQLPLSRLKTTKLLVSVERYWGVVNENQRLQRKIIQLEQKVGQLTRGRR